MRIAVSVCMVINFLVGVAALGQEPDWEINPSDFSNSMIILGVILDDEVELSSENDRIAAFINGELAGVGNLTFEQSVNKHLGFLIVYSNDDGGEITFKYYNSVNNEQVDVPGTLLFEIDGLIGNALIPYKWANREVNTESELLSFTLENAIHSASIYGTEVSIDVPEGTDLNLIAEFELSDGAEARIENTIQESEVSLNDYSNSVEFVVTSEDGRFSTTYTIVVNEVAVILSSADFSDSGLRVYPNPVYDWLRIDLPNSFNDYITVYDIQGRFMMDSRLTSGRHVEMVNMKNFEKGLYFLKAGDSILKIVKK